MNSPDEIQQIRNTADLLTRSDRPDLADRMRKTAADLEVKAAKKAREDAAKLQAAADVMLDRSGKTPTYDNLRGIANDILAPFEGITDEKIETAAIHEFLTAYAEKAPAAGPTVVTMPLGSGIWPPTTGFLRPKSESFKTRREGYDAGVRAAAALLRAESRKTRKKGFAAAADLLDALLPGSTAKK